MIASLPMYDWPETRSITDEWWQGLHKALVKEGVSTAPSWLSRHSNDHHNWKSADLIVGQTCGYPYTHGYADHLRILGIPDYNVSGCDNYQYQSLILCRKDQPFSDLTSFRNSIAVINNYGSHSGFSAFRHSIAKVAESRKFFKQVLISGGHRFSMEALCLKKADICAVDPVSFALAQKYVPELVEPLQIITFTEPAPCLPLVCHKFITDDLFDRVQQAIFKAFIDPSLEEVRQMLFLNDIKEGQPRDYQRIIIMENEAIESGYAELR